MTSRTTKAPKTLNNSVSGSSIKTCLTQDISLKSPGLLKQQQEKKDKKVDKKNPAETPDVSREENDMEATTENASEGSRAEELRAEAQPPTKGEMAEMLMRLENTIKGEIHTLRTNFGFLLFKD